jgi:hypothetical protein
MLPLPAEMVPVVVVDIVEGDEELDFRVSATAAPAAPAAATATIMAMVLPEIPAPAAPPGSCRWLDWAAF